MTEKPLYKHLGQRSRVFPIASITIGREKEVLEREEFLCGSHCRAPGWKIKTPCHYKPPVLIWQSSRLNAKTRSRPRSWQLLNTREGLWSRSPGEGTGRTFRCSRTSFLWEQWRTLVHYSQGNLSVKPAHVWKANLHLDVKGQYII